MSEGAGQSESVGRLEQLPALDGLRAIAALSVVLTHVGTLSGRSFDTAWGAYLARADVGVAVFFVLSGFLLGRPFLRAVIDDLPRPKLGPYLKRRVLRIFPAYWFIFGVIALGYGIVATSAGALLSQFFLLHIYDTSTTLGPSIRSASGELGHPLGPSWSLAVEISFYAFLPLLAACLARACAGRDRRGRRRLATAVVVSLVVCSLCLRLAAFASLSVARAGLVGTWLPLNLDWFGAGMLLALAAEAERTGELSPSLARLTGGRFLPIGSWGIAAVTFVLVSKGVGIVPTQLTFSTAESLARQVLYGAVGFFLLVPLALGPRRSAAIRSALAATPLRQLGLISYGIYLWQDVVIDQYLRHTPNRYFASPFWESLAFVVGGSALAAAISYWLVERPALALKGRRLLPERGPLRSRQ